MRPLPPPDRDPAAWETVTDPTGSFTCAVPRGWRSALSVHRVGAQVVELVAAEEPAPAGARMFAGDPSIPMFASAPMFPTPGVVARPYTSIEHLLPPYAHQNFSSVPGYAPVGIRPEPALVELHQRRLAAAGVPGGVTAARLRFDHEGGATVLLGAAVSFGPVWQLDIAGVTAPDDPDAWVPALLGLLASRRATPAAQQRFDAERAASAAQHQATMASIQQHTSWMQQAHAQRMHDLRANAAAHQSRMDDLHATFDAANAGWHARQAESVTAAPGDGGHRAFVDAMTGQHDVVGPDGEVRRVDDGFERYFRSRHDGSWVGLKAHEQLADALRGTGVDPASFDEWTRRR
ncbi:MAG: hypothetical protein R3F59_18980 [Myxococcota bacterium]